MITLDPHPLLDAVAFVTRFPAPLGDMPTPEPLLALLRPGAVAPISPGDDVRAAVRDLLRLGGFKPTGRSKPASEYLIRASADGALGSINLAVDVCNIVSLHSGLPISVVDLSRASAPFRLGVAAPDTRYVFNASGQPAASLPLALAACSRCSTPKVPAPARSRTASAPRPAPRPPRRSR